MPDKTIMIVAMTLQRVIGNENNLPWNLPGDMAFFKRTTTGHNVVMGRKTFESIGKPLPKRNNIVLTRDPEWSHPGVQVAHNLDQVNSLVPDGETLFVIGGSEIYEMYLGVAEEMYVTCVFDLHPGDVKFPEFLHLYKSDKYLERTDDYVIVQMVKRDKV